MARYHLLIGSSEEELARALRSNPALRTEIEEELASLTDAICERCYSSRSYRQTLLRVAGHSTETLEKIESDHAQRMVAALKKAKANA